MEPSPGSDYPRLCAEAGLSCEECTQSTAVELARACRGLRGKMVGQMFVQIHAHPACSKMHAHFAESYREATRILNRGTVESVIEMEIPRKGAERERSAMVAVA